MLPSVVAAVDMIVAYKSFLDMHVNMQRMGGYGASPGARD